MPPVDIEYKTLAATESTGPLGFLGIRLQIATSAPYNQQAVEDDAWRMMNKFREEIVAAIMAASPKAQASAQLQQADLLGCFDASPIYVEKIPNGYCSLGCCRHLPWFVVKTTVGRIKIGWRKRVIEIDWTETTNTKEAHELFPHEDVTKGERDIHAWSLDKAKSYVSAIIAAGTQDINAST